jgi:hypothetical protein
MNTIHIRVLGTTHSNQPHILIMYVYMSFPPWEGYIQDVSWHGIKMWAQILSGKTNFTNQRQNLKLDQIWILGQNVSVLNVYHIYKECYLLT